MCVNTSTAGAACAVPVCIGIVERRSWGEGALVRGGMGGASKQGVAVRHPSCLLLLWFAGAESAQQRSSACLRSFRWYATPCADVVRWLACCRGVVRCAVRLLRPSGAAILVSLKNDPKTKYVIKEVKINHMSRKEQDEARREVNFLKSLHHSNIVECVRLWWRGASATKHCQGWHRCATDTHASSSLWRRFVDSFVDRGKLCIVMGYADAGDLKQMLDKRKRARRGLNEEEVLHYFVQITLALKHMHDQHILHRDLKSQVRFPCFGGWRLRLSAASNAPRVCPVEYGNTSPKERARSLTDAWCALCCAVCRCGRGVWCARFLFFVFFSSRMCS